MERSPDAMLASLFSKTKIMLLRIMLDIVMDYQATGQHCLKSPHSQHLACNWHLTGLQLAAEGPNQKRGMPILYECYPTRDLRVIPAANIITRACLAPCFLDCMLQYHTIPRRLEHFDREKADEAVPLTICRRTVCHWLVDESSS